MVEPEFKFGFAYKSSCSVSIQLMVPYENCIYSYCSKRRKPKTEWDSKLESLIAKSLDILCANAGEYMCLFLTDQAFIIIII